MNWYTVIKDNPCWDGYEQIGMKEKNGKQVPNCVPIVKKSVKQEIQSIIAVMHEQIDKLADNNASQWGYIQDKNTKKYEYIQQIIDKLGEEIRS